MKRKLSSLLSVAIATFSFSINALADDLSAGTYYIQNVECGKYVSVGANWGTRSILSDAGVDFNVTVNDGAYTLGTRIVAEGKALRPSDGFMDQSGTWTITDQGDGTYTIQGSAGYFRYDGTSIPAVNGEEGAKGIYWRFITKEELLTKMNAATASNPQDATFLIKSPDFWTKDCRVTTDKCWGSSLAIGGESSGGNTLLNNYNGELYNKSVGTTAKQTIKDAPAGKYVLTCYAFYRPGSSDQAAAAFEEGSGKNAVLFANESVTYIKNICDGAPTVQGGGYTTAAGKYFIPLYQNQAAACFEADDNYIHTLEFVHSGGDLTIGVEKYGYVTSDWLLFDNFRLKYYGKPKDLSTYVLSLNNAISSAEGVSGKMNTSVAGALATAISTYKNAVYETGEEYTAAIKAVKDATSDAQTSVAVYSDVANYLSQADVLDATGKAAYIANETIVALNTAYENGTLESLSSEDLSAIKEAYRTAVLSQKSKGADMSGAIVNNDFKNCENNNFPGWTIEAASGSNTWKNGDHNVEYWYPNAAGGSFDYYQTITGLPAGTYKLTARMWNSTNGEGGTEFAPTCGVYGTTESGTSYGLVTDNITNDQMKEYSTENFMVENGELRLGVKNSTTMAARWFGVDIINLTLVEYGIGLDSYVSLLETRVGEAKELAKKAMSATAYSALDKVIKANDGKTYSTTSEYSKAISNVDSALAVAKPSVEAYADIYSYIGKGDELDENGKAVFNGDETVSALLSEYNNGTIEPLTEEQKTALTSLYVAAVKVQTTPGSNMTAAIVNPSFETGTTDGWTVGSSNDTGARDNRNATYTMSGADGNWVFNTWQTGLPITQTVTDIPNGTYKLNAVVASDAANTVFITANSERKGANSTDKGHGAEVELEFYVSDNTATIGAIGGKGSLYDEEGGDWYKVDNFRLTYVSDDVPAPSLGTATFTGSDSDDAKLVITFDNFSNQLAATSADNKYVINIKINDEDYSNTCSADKGAVIGYNFSSIETYTIQIPDGGIKLVNSMDEVIAETKGTIKETFSLYSDSFTNSDFSFGTPVAGTIRTYAKDIASSKETSGMQSVPGWSYTVGGDAHAAGTFEYGTNVGLGDPDHKVPAAGPAGTNGYGLGVLGVWSASSYYTQTIRLEAGNYMVQIPTYNAGGTDKVSNLTGVIIKGKTTYSKTSDFKVGVWTTQTVEFTLTETTAVTISLGYTSLNKGSGSCPHFFYDRVDIFTNDEIEQAKLASAKSDALATVNALSPIGDGIFKYNQEEINTAIAAINASTTVEDVAKVEVPDMKVPAEDKTYQVALQSSGKFMTLNGTEGVKLSNYAQPLYIVENKGGYALTDGTQSLAYQGSNTWSLVGAANASTLVISPTDEAYTIKSTNGYLGVDTDDAGSNVYGNKDAHNWIISEYVPVEISISNATVIESYDHIVADNITINTAVDGTAVIINNGSVTANSLTVNVDIPNNEWSFMIMPCDVPVADFKSTQADTQWKIYSYDGVARANGDFDNVWVAATESSVLSKGTGSIIQSRRGEETSSTFSFTTTDVASIASAFADDDIKVSLAENKSDYACNSGWNLVGNPYLAFFNKSQMSSSAPITVWDGSNYVTYTSDDKYALSPLQAFFIQTSEAAEVTFGKAGRQLTASVSSDANARKVSSSMDRNLYNITLSDGNFTDKTRFVINEGASLDYEIGTDASKFMSEESSVPQIFTVENDVKYSVNERPMSQGVINLGVRVASAGTYTISAGNIASAVVLEDKLTGKAVLLNDESDSYSFTVSEAGTIVGRFVIHVDSDATAISDIAMDDANDVIYTLQGVRVAKNAAKHGIYLVGGKKVMIK